MKTHKLNLDDTFEEEFHIFAVYSDEEAYRLAFLLNQHLSIQLKKADSIVTKKEQTEFLTFEYDQIELFLNWLLIHNHSLSEKEVQKPDDLFSQDSGLYHQKTYLIKELKKARFILKVNGEFSNNQLLLLSEKLQNIPQIYAIELVNLTQFKDNQLLSF